MGACSIYLKSKIPGLPEASKANHTSKSYPNLNNQSDVSPF